MNFILEEYRREYVRKFTIVHYKYILYDHKIIWIIKKIMVI